MLEYFDGIMFLTTNRVDVIDPAFKSRIHFSIAYPDLSPQSRSQLWKLFILQGNAQQSPEWLTDEFLCQIAEFDINGRQIKNAARVAHAVAASRKRAVTGDDILSVLQSLKLFEEDFRLRSSKSKAAKEARTIAGHCTCSASQIAELPVIV